MLLHTKDVARVLRRHRCQAGLQQNSEAKVFGRAHVEFVVWKAIYDIVCVACAAGQGDKLILRNALRQLGLPRAAARVKRAIQFGTQLAKISNIRDFGSNRGPTARHAGTLKLERQ